MQRSPRRERTPAKPAGEGAANAVKLTINGKPRELEGPLTVAQYLETLGAAGRYVAVARNGEVLDRAAFADVALEDGDCIEIARPVGGGKEAVGGRGAADRGAAG